MSHKFTLAVHGSDVTKPRAQQPYKHVDTFTRARRRSGAQPLHSVSYFDDGLRRSFLTTPPSTPAIHGLRLRCHPWHPSCFYAATSVSPFKVYIIPAV